MLPARLRTVRAGRTYGQAPRGFSATPISLAWPNKSPAALLDYSVDFTDLIDDCSDALGSAFATVAPAPADPYANWCPTWPRLCAPTPPTPTGMPLAINSLAVTGNIATALLAAGMTGTPYLVTFQAYTAAGRQLAAIVSLFVNTDAALGASPAASSNNLGVAVGPFSPLTPAEPSQTTAANNATPQQFKTPWPSLTGGTVEILNGDNDDITIAVGATNGLTPQDGNGYLVRSGDRIRIGVAAAMTWFAIKGTGPGTVYITQGTGG